MKNWKEFDREQLMVEVAELYYEAKKTQKEISTIVGKTRPTISKLLKEALDKQIVEVRIHRPVHFDHGLEMQLEETFDLKKANVFVWHKGEEEHLRRYLGIVGASVVKMSLHPGVSIGVTWGTTLQAIIDAMEETPVANAKVVQLAGALGGRGEAYDAISLVQRLSDKLHGKPYYLNAPFLVENAAMARSLLSNTSNYRTIEMGKECDIVLIGIGKVDPHMSTLYLGGHISLSELDALKRHNVIGDVCGHPIDSDGKDAAEEFNSRVISISRKDLKTIPTRIAAAGGIAKAAPILGALLGGYVHQLVTDNATAEEVLKLYKIHEGKQRRK